MYQLTDAKLIAAFPCHRHAISDNVSVGLVLLLDYGHPMRNQWLMEQALKERPLLLTAGKLSVRRIEISNVLDVKIKL